MNMSSRPRRNRKSEQIRELIAETSLESRQLIYPVFICEGQKVKDPLKAMPGQFRWSVDELSKKIAEWKELGISHYAIFPAVPENKKDSRGQEGLNENGLLPKALKTLKDNHPEISLISDIALDPYSSDGHDGLVKNGNILNDETVEILAKMAIKHAQWGADWVAPSDMMDGRIAAIRQALDQSGFSDTNILSYTAKYASAFYGPFREALDSAPKKGDKKTYQMDPRNSREALREAKLDIQEGADMIMVKPGLPYLDVIYRLKKYSTIPVAAYNVSGEYSMIHFAAQAGVMDLEKAMMECLFGFRRAGADAILTYFAPEAARILADS